MRFPVFVVLCAALLLNACSSAEVENSSPVHVSESGLRMEELAGGLADPWGMDFLPDGTLLVTEKPGGLLWLDLASGERQAVTGVPESREIGQGGQLDVLVHPVDGEAPWIYLSYAVEKDGKYSTRVSRARWAQGELTDLEVLFTALPYYSTKRHFGSRLLIHDGYLYFSVGDRANRDYAQDLGRHNGKVMRLYPDGQVPADNPFVGRADTQPEIWTYGHRNPQGMALNPVDGSIWVVEHGPRGGDEINRLVAGTNYGWPIITYGQEYAGGKIGIGTHKEGMAQPQKYYVPSIAACGMDFYSGDLYPGWKDSFLIAALRGTHLNRVRVEGEDIGQEYRLFEDSQLRFRDVQQGPDGYVYVLAGGDRLFRLLPSGG